MLRRQAQGVRRRIDAAARHRWALDPLIAVALLAPWWATLLRADEHIGVTPWNFVIAAGGTLPVAFRRLWPRAAFVVASFSVLAALLSSHPEGSTGIGAAFVGYTLIVALGVAAVVGVAVVGVGLEVVSAFRFETDFQGVALDLTLLVAVIVAAYATRVRHLNAALLEERAARLEQDRHEAAAAAVAAERAHIARELHDIVAHAMSQITVQAGAGRLLGDAHPGRAVEALGAIETLSRDAMTEMRRLTRALRDGSDDDDRVPLHGIADIAALSQTLAGSGVTIDMDVQSGGRPLPLSVDAAAYRIVQEALTNAARHAAPTNATVSLRVDHDHVAIEVVDTGPLKQRPPAQNPGGLGLRGMRERVEILGGQLVAGPRARGFAVSARLPIEAAR